MSNINLSKYYAVLTGHSKYSDISKNYCHPGLEKSSVLPVLDRFLSLKTDFVLNRKQKNRSIKVRFFRPFLNASL